MQQAIQSLQQFAQTKDQVIQNMQRLQQQGQGTNQTFQQFNQQINQTNNTLNQTNQQFNQFNQTINNVTNNMSQATQGAQTFGNTWRTILQIAGGIGLATSLEAAVRSVGHLTESLVNLGQEIVQTGVRMETLRTAFAGSFGGAAQGQEAFRQTIEQAQRLGLNLENTAAIYRRFENAIRGTSIEGDRGRQIFENYVTAARGLGLSTHETNQFLNAVVQTLQRGHVSMEEWRRQMGNVAPAMQVAARAYTTTTDAIEKMIKAGTDSIPFVEQVGRQFAQEFGPAAEGAGRTAAAAFERLRTEITLLKEAIATSGLLEFVGNLTKSLTDLLQSMRGIREEREREAGGPRVAIPPELAQSPAVQRRQAEIERLRSALEAQAGQVQVGEMPDLAAPLQTLGMTADEVRARLRALEEEQRKAIDATRRMNEEELARQQRMATADPRRVAAENLMKILREGEERLRDIDVRATIEPDLDVLNEKLKATEKTLQDVRKAFDALGAGVQAPMVQGFKPSQYDPLLNRIATELGINPNVARALMEQESGGQAGVVSRAGAIGLMQVMPGTGRQLGYTPEQLREPESNIRAGLTYLAQLLEKFGGDINRALTAYNAGPARGGIPLPTGENATFARDVLARIPGDPLGVVQQAQRQRDAIRAALDDQKAQAKEAADTIHDIRQRQAEEERDRAHAAETINRFERQLQQQEEADAKHAADTIAQLAHRQDELQQRQLRQLENLAASYGMTKQARDADTASKLAAAQAGTEEYEAAQKLAKAVADSAKVLETVPARRAEAARSFAEFEGLRGLRDQIEQAQETLPGGEATLFTPSRRLVQLRQRTMREVTSEEGRQQAEADLQQLEGLEKLTYAAQRFQEFGTSVGSAWTQSLISIANHTQTVSEAFRAMAQSILQSMIQITSQEAWRSFVQLGLRLILGTATSGFSGLYGPSGTFDPSASASSIAYARPIQGFQAGGMVNRPTLAYIGENPATSPEYILNRQQMAGLMGSMRATTSAAAGNPSPVTIINVSSQAEAQQQRLSQEAMGRQVVINHVLQDLSAGEGSRINRAIRTLSR